MKEKLVSYKNAKLAKEAGFNEPCKNNVWAEDSYTETEDAQRNESYSTIRYSAPTQSLLQKWLMEKYDIWVRPIRHIPYPNNSWKAIIEYERNDILRKGEKYVVTFEVFPNNYRGVEEGGTYEDAFEAGLQEALKIGEIKNK